MNKVNKKFIISIALIIVIMIIFTSEAFAINPDDPRWNPNPSVNGGGTFIERAGKILGFLKYIGAIISVLALSIIGIKYMFGSVEAKAEYKKSMFPYIIGCILIGGVTVLLAVIEQVAKA